jgi:hypothetical protein
VRDFIADVWRTQDYRLLTLIVNALVGPPGGKGLTASLTRTVKRIGAVVEFADVGIPLITPVVAFNDKPRGRGLGAVGEGRTTTMYTAASPH